MTWTTEPSTFTTWDLDRSGLGEITRITDDLGYVRVTEQGQIRIIERFATSWTTESTTFNPWTKE